MIGTDHFYKFVNFTFMLPISCFITCQKYCFTFRSDNCRGQWSSWNQIEMTFALWHGGLLNCEEPLEDCANEWMHMVSNNTQKAWASNYDCPKCPKKTLPKPLPAWTLETRQAGSIHSVMAETRNTGKTQMRTLGSTADGPSLADGPGYEAAPSQPHSLRWLDITEGRGFLQRKSCEEAFCKGRISLGAEQRLTVKAESFWRLRRGLTAKAAEVLWYWAA